MLLLIFLLIHPPYEFIYLSLIKEAAPLLTTALRKLTVCPSNLQSSSPYGTPLMQMPSWVLKFLRQDNTKVLLSTNLLACSSATFHVGKTDRCLSLDYKNILIWKTLRFVDIWIRVGTFINFNPLLVLPFNNPELLPQIVLNNTVIIDKCMNWSLLLYKDTLHILRHKPKLN
jgi:hypothetical protein